MGQSLEYFLTRLAERAPEHAAVVEAISEAYKICHPVELGGKDQKRQYGTHHPYAANPLYTVPSGCAEAHGAARSKSQNVRLSHEPLDKSNLGVNMSHVATSAFVEANDRKHTGKCQGDKSVHIFSYKELIPAMEAILRSRRELRTVFTPAGALNPAYVNLYYDKDYVGGVRSESEDYLAYSIRCVKD